MITLRRSEDRGHADHGWLDARHTFSFAGYHDPAHVRFGPLRVLNQDRIAPGAGFPTHGHDNMEIVTVPLEGTLEHRDSTGSGSQLVPGDVQLMSAGTGVTHSEFNASRTEPLHLLQMWVFPRERDTEPRYEETTFHADERRGRFRLAVSPDGADGSLTIGADARLFVGLVGPGESAAATLREDGMAWLHLASGRARLVADGGEPVDLAPGDGAGIEGNRELRLEGVEDAEFVLWEFPAA